MSCDKDQGRKEVPYMKCPVIMAKKDAYINNGMQLQNLCLAFIHKISFQLPAFYLVHPCPTTLQQPWTS